MTGLEIQIEIKRRGLRQADVARAAGYDAGHFSKLLTGAYPTWPDEFEATCKQAIEAVAREKAAQLLGTAA